MGYRTHKECRNQNSLDSLVVLWEYNNLSSTLLKKYKYGLATEIEKTIEELMKYRLKEIPTITNNINALCIPVPVSHRRLMERGFNQTENITRCISNILNINFSKEVICRRDGEDIHQSLLDRSERIENKIGFYISNYEILKDIDEILIVDDVITTGSTIEQISEIIKSFDKNIKVRGVCLFRGRPYFNKKGEAKTSPKI